jgi:hypothetical protein
MNIVPMRDLKNTTKIEALCKETKEAVFVTKNGYGALVVMDMDLYEDLTFSIVSSFDLFSDEEGDEYSYAGTYMVEGENDDGNPVLLFQCDQGDFELVWDGEELGNDTFFAWYEGE